MIHKLLLIINIIVIIMFFLNYIYQYISEYCNVILLIIKNGKNLLLNYILS